MNILTSRFVGLTIAMIHGLLFYPIYAQQERSSIIKGTVKSGEVTLDYATVFLKDTQISTNSDQSGNFSLKVPAGKYTLCVSYLGYQTYEEKIEIKPSEKLIRHVQMEKESNNLNEVVVLAKSPVQQINESAYNVVAIDAKALRNTTMDVANVLDRVTGIKIREEGGVGSSTQISLNGFTGRHVKFFMDGIPLDASGDGFPISNIPLGIAERIEVYKGVVPVEFGADALGGAINIVTGKSTNTVIDASYSYGSFNTHKSSINFMHTLKNGISMQLNAYQNYSDNDYKVKIDEYLDVNTGIYIKDPKWFKRFHDRYHNEAVIAKIGVVDKTWADRLMFGIRYMHEDTQIQNANIMTIVFGGKKQKTKNLSPSLEYEKKNLFTQNLNVSLSGRYDRATINNIDTLAREYSWTGQYRIKSSQGEANKTIAKQIDKAGYITSNINYNVDGKHFVSLNNMFSSFNREEKDAAIDKNTDRKSQKDVLGLSYKFAPDETWNALAFVKYYNIHVVGPIDTTKNSSGLRSETRSNNYSLTGYGAAATYNLLKSLQLKASFEKTYRLPTPKELFGDGTLEKGNAAIKPENSRNINFNIMLNQPFLKDHTITLDAGFIYRDIRNFIKRNIDNNGFGRSVNLKKVLSVGGEFEAHYFYKNKLSIGGNLTYQNMRNREKLPASDPKSNIYDDRIPNIPYFFGNADASYNFFNILGKKNTLSVGYNLHYIHKFYKEWQSEGGEISIPEQFSHDINLTYTLKDGRYNFAFEARNFTDETLYDNFYLQKPGRSFTVKFRFFFFKQNNK